MQRFVCLLSQLAMLSIALFFFSELCWGKAVVAYTMPQKRKKEDSERLRGERGERDQIKFFDLRFERWQVIRSSELCRGKAMATYTMPQQRKKEESERLRREREITSRLLILDSKDGKL